MARRSSTNGDGGGSPTAAYDARSIQTLEGLEAVRKRPGMYIGGTGADGLMHLVWELIDNGVDEAAAGHADRIEVTLHRDRSVEVADNGRGIPIDKHPKKNVTALEVVLTELHAGGKFGGGVYTASGGLHGVGASVVNALSHKLVAEVDRDGATWRLGFKNGKPGRYDGSSFTRGHDLEKVKRIAKTKTGTRVRFWPDWEIFDDEAEIDHDRIRDRVSQACFLVPGLKIRLVDKRPGDRPEPEEFVSRGGLADYVEHLATASPVTEVITLSGIDTFSERVSMEGRTTSVERECTVDIALRWVADYDSRLVSYVNTIPTPSGGTHVAGFERALTRAVNDVLLTGTKKLAKLAKDGNDRAQKEDVQEGLVAAIKVTVPEPQFRGQTKQELGTPAVQGIVYEVVKDGLTDWFSGAGPKTHVNALRDKVATAVVGRVQSKQALEARRKAANLGSTGMPDKLADCRIHGEDSELLVVEGDSAAGPAKAGRDADTMAILPLRGKVVNAGKSSLKQVIDNAEAQALFTAMGAGSGPDFDLAKARYGRLIILCDADVDGSHIRCLLLTLVYKYMRPLLEAGRVYAAQPPLYSAKWRGTTHYAFSDAEREAVIDRHGVPRDKFVRFKGLGEMDVDELIETTLDPATRVLKRITMDEAQLFAEIDDVFEVLMGSDVSRRREFLVSNSDLVSPDALDV